MNQQRLQRLLDAGRALTSELDYETVLARLLDIAREITTARYAALGVLDERREGLERFVTSGLDAETERLIGDRPRGRGVLGVLITDPKPLRLADVGDHPLSYGFPFAHPPMGSFLGVPIVLGGRAWGNLYLTEHADGAFTEEDEEAVVVLAAWAALAIRNARLYRDIQQRHDELARANRGLETMAEVGRAFGGETDSHRVLELVAKRSRALLEARAAEIALLDGDEFVIAAGAGAGMGEVIGERIPIEGSLAASVLRTGRARRFDRVPSGVFARDRLGASCALVTPMMFRGRTVGLLVLLDRLGDRGGFDADDERVLEAFAASAASAVATAQSASDEARRRGVAASEAERRRWARELHDETLQELAGLRVILSGARRSGDPKRLEAAVDEALDLVTDGVANLRGLIAELRPAVLDELGLEAAVRSLGDRVAERDGVAVDVYAHLDRERGELRARLDEHVESTAFRLVQEALTNVLKHADATRVTVELRETSESLSIAVRDDGRGFSTDARTEGYGLLGMQERVALMDGRLSVRSAEGEGTEVVATLPLAPHTHAAAAAS